MTTPPDPPELVTMIAQQLGETERGPIFQIQRIVRRLGADAALASSMRKKSQGRINSRGGPCC